MSIFEGAGVAIITPMNQDGSVNYDEFGRIIEDQISGGTDAIIVCGFSQVKLPQCQKKNTWML